MISKPPIVFGVPRSGSTLIFNIINVLFKDVGGVDSQIHHLPIPSPIAEDKYLASQHLDKLSCENKIIATYRDFRNCLVSAMKLNDTKIKNELTFDSVKMKNKYFLNISNRKLRTSLSHLEKLKQLPKGRVLFLQYEKFFNNFNYIFEKLEDFYDYKFPSEKKEWITENFDIKHGNDKLAKVMMGFYHEKHLGPNHISDTLGKTDWKTYKIDFNELELSILRPLEYHLKLWGYEV